MSPLRTRHYTPIDIAEALSRHAPQNISSLLEPAVGTGVLLRPLLGNLRASVKRIVCIDQDKKAIERVKRELTPLFGESLKVIQQDFLFWTPQQKTEKQFDCVLMNPPFLGKKSNAVPVQVKLDMNQKYVTRCLPPEVAFVLKAVEMLRPGGRLLAIVPCSVVSSSSTSFIRTMLMRTGWVRYVHELPRFSFKDVEAKFYLLVYQKGAEQGDLQLCNHDLFSPDKIVLSRSKLTEEARFDYSYIQATIWLEQTQKYNRTLSWAPISSLASVYRGAVGSPQAGNAAMHTWDFHDGFWDPKGRLQNHNKRSAERNVKIGDLLLKRVGRACASSLGPINGCTNFPCSDCILLIRPHVGTSSPKLLFTLRTLLSWEFGSALIERGTGASYVTENSLLCLSIPINLSDHFKLDFDQYTKALKRNDGTAMCKIEKKIRARLSEK